MHRLHVSSHRLGALALVLTLGACAPQAAESVDQARELLSSGQPSEATALIQRLAAGGADPAALSELVPVLEERSIALFNEGDEDGALALFTETSSVFGEDPDWTFAMARIHEGRGELPKAIKALKGGLELPGEHKEILSHLIDIYWSLNQSQLAKETVLGVREAGWSDANTALPLGVTLGRLGEFDAAKVELQKARENGADPVSLDYNLALLLKTEKKFDEAREKLISVRENGEGDIAQIAHREFLRLEIDTGRVDGLRAKELLDECWELSDLRPSDWRVFELLGDLFMIQEDPYAAKGAYENALKHGRNPAVIEDKYRKAAQAILDLEGETAQGR